MQSLATLGRKRPTETMLPTGLCCQLACIWEATARKPGNVHRFQDFDGLTYLDLIASAAAIAPILDTARARPIGVSILEAVRATRQVVNTNTNLGIILLLVPLAAVDTAERLDAGIAAVLNGLDVADAQAVYRAIRLAVPGALGRALDQDIAQEPTLNLRDIMGLAAKYDMIARQYANGFEDILIDGCSGLQYGLQHTVSLETAIIYCHLHLLAGHADSLIARKKGAEEALAASDKAKRVLDLGWPTTEAGWAALTDFDTWLRADGHARNPGTTADLVTACLFVHLRNGTIDPRATLSWQASTRDG